MTAHLDLDIMRGARAAFSHRYPEVHFDTWLWKSQQKSVREPWEILLDACRSYLAESHDGFAEFPDDEICAVASACSAFSAVTQLNWITEHQISLHLSLEGVP